MSESSAYLLSFFCCVEILHNDFLLSVMLIVYIFFAYLSPCYECLLCLVCLLLVCRIQSPSSRLLYWSDSLSMTLCPQHIDGAVASAVNCLLYYTWMTLFHRFLVLMLHHTVRSRSFLLFFSAVQRTCMLV